MLCYSTTTWSSLYMATIKAVSQHKSRQQSHKSSPTVPFSFCMKYSTYPVRASVDIERVRATEGQTKRARKKTIIVFHICLLAEHQLCLVFSSIEAGRQREVPKGKEKAFTCVCMPRERGKGKMKGVMGGGWIRGQRFWRTDSILPRPYELGTRAWRKRKKPGTKNQS